jgi:glutaminyl-peptide cyclotransferase
MRISAILLLTALLFSCNNADVRTDGNTVTDNPIPPVIPYTVVNSFPHDTASFTEGLIVHQGVLYESTGSPDAPPNNGSWFAQIDLKTGKPVKKIELDKQFFGEGLTIFNGKIYQLTYQHQKGFVYDAETFKKLKEFTYTGEGWSLTHDSTHLIMSDGTSNLRYLDPEALTVVKILGVHDNNGPVSNINELEYINGYIYSNIWQTNYIYKIDPASGRVVAKIDLSTLVNEARTRHPNAEVLNGIAYDAQQNRIFVTGKFWPSVYEVRF